MRTLLLASGAMLGLALTTAANAQQASQSPMPNPTTSSTSSSSTSNGTTPTPSTTGATTPSSTHRQAQTGARPGNVVGTGASEPRSARASNITTADTRSAIAPSLPVPPIPESSAPRQFLQVAEAALQQHRTGEAQEALERAETRLLDRSTAPASANTPDQGPMIRQITTARDALARGDTAQASQIIQQALAQAPTTSNSMSSGASPAAAPRTTANGTSM